MAESSWSPDRIVYVASGDRRITAGMIEELLAAQSRSAPARPVQRRAAARQAERDRIAARDPIPRPIPPNPSGREPANAASTPPRGRLGAPPPGSGGRPDPRVAALELEVDDLEHEVAGLRHLLALRTRVEKAAVNYRPGAADRRCGNCVMFHAGILGADRTCDLVRGLIDPDAVCDRWEAR